MTSLEYSIDQRKKLEVKNFYKRTEDNKEAFIIMIIQLVVRFSNMFLMWLSWEPGSYWVRSPVNIGGQRETLFKNIKITFN